MGSTVLYKISGFQPKTAKHKQQTKTNEQTTLSRGKAVNLTKLRYDPDVGTIDGEFKILLSNLEKAL